MKLNSSKRKPTPCDNPPSSILRMSEPTNKITDVNIKNWKRIQCYFCGATGRYHHNFQQKNGLWGCGW